MDAKLIVDEVRLTPILISDPPLLNVQGVHQPYTPRLVVEVVTRGGVSGLGETYGDTVYLDIAGRLAEVLPGRSITDVNALFALSESVDPHQADVDPAVDAGGLRGVRTADKLRLSVVSAFETACLDALGRTLGLPVHALLGGKVRDSVEYSAYLFHRWATHPAGGPVDDWGAALDPAGIVAQARRFDRLHGFRSFKLKGGVFEPEREIAAIRALAEAFPGRPLRLDPNGAWSVETSLAVARELGDVLEYLEDPASGTDAMAEIAARTDVPLATNMCVTTFEEVPEAFAKEAVRIVLCDHHYWGGLGRTRELAALCRTYGVGLSMHSNTHLGISLAAMTQVAATLPGLHHACDTHYPWQTEDVITTRPVFRAGRLAVSDAPGLGVDLDRDALAALHHRWLSDDGTHHDRDDTAAMRGAAPDWKPSSW
ncbi:MULTISPECIES: enolase C-terminal domain-like protein [Streptomyces]|uniref:glucarate dehydratase n=1 Tax=Streptomyces venezuelae (strain ATCC 10712 / CBS 650.69 / DSM 40230 / JCM 4526 / NBRC 13096 / PD 04745) TaxID=953739 RepID=F2RE38_STRVP|nr:enolase C-terminal domain-like protein [Streptomyces venezuelae]APE20661.1 glucarate dehydratase [Streptomyces venezuelae]QER98050.1 glucarate dehydratase [Streptomyces venezuelae ATCC 10712]CCA54578.1 Glucarate dehydratase [Streptomyces venezuelae ATCC 10712]